MATLPCDTPFVGQAEILALIEALGDAEVAHAVTQDGPQGLCAIWRCEVGPALAARLAAGDHPPVHRLLAEIGSRQVRFANPAPFRNINAQADLG